jgi:hypothetical protein
VNFFLSVTTDHSQESIVLLCPASQKRREHQSTTLYCTSVSHCSELRSQERRASSVVDATRRAEYASAYVRHVRRRSPVFWFFFYKTLFSDLDWRWHRGRNWSACHKDKIEIPYSMWVGNRSRRTNPKWPGRPKLSNVIVSRPRSPRPLDIRTKRMLVI